MFYKTKISYSVKPTLENYPSVVATYVWVKDLPDTTGLNATVVSYIQPKWVLKKVNHNFQSDINSQYCITPKVIATTGANPNPTNKQMVYQSVPLENLNATDVRNGSKQIADTFILNQATKITNQQLADVANKNLVDKDAQIKQLQDEIKTLKEGK